MFGKLVFGRNQQALGVLLNADTMCFKVVPYPSALKLYYSIFLGCLVYHTTVPGHITTAYHPKSRGTDSGIWGY